MNTLETTFAEVVEKHLHYSYMQLMIIMMIVSDHSNRGSKARTALRKQRVEGLRRFEPEAKVVKLRRSDNDDLPEFDSQEAMKLREIELTGLQHSLLAANN
mmetsp:Transcript_33992/g.43698  ORF Transcript_33992/g.43698 Transcript_33992/m.43698 type:complete len:101 (+) Transcript_33992:168-470(+)